MSQQRPTPEDAWIKVKRRRVAEKQGWKCYWCGLPMNQIRNDPMQASLDHLIPKHNGGVTRPGTYVAAHRRCNETRNPEINHSKASDPQLTVLCGDPTPVSPFAILKGKIK